MAGAWLKPHGMGAGRAWRVCTLGACARGARVTWRISASSELELMGITWGRRAGWRRPKCCCAPTSSLRVLGSRLEALLGIPKILRTQVWVPEI